MSKLFYTTNLRDFWERILPISNSNLVAQLSYLNYTIKSVINSTSALDYMRKSQTVFCPDFLTELFKDFRFFHSACPPFLILSIKKTADFSHSATSQRSDFWYSVFQTCRGDGLSKPFADGKSRRDSRTSGARGVAPLTEQSDATLSVKQFSCWQRKKWPGTHYSR